MDGTVVSEQSEIALGLFILFAILLVVLLDLHLRWSDQLDERERELNKREERLKRLERGVFLERGDLNG